MVANWSVAGGSTVQSVVYLDDGRVVVSPEDGGDAGRGGQAEPGHDHRHHDRAVTPAQRPNLVQHARCSRKHQRNAELQTAAVMVATARIAADGCVRRAQRPNKSIVQGLSGICSPKVHVLSRWGIRSAVLSILSVMQHL